MRQALIWRTPEATALATRCEVPPRPFMKWSSDPAVAIGWLIHALSAVSWAASPPTAGLGANVNGTVIVWTATPPWVKRMLASMTSGAPRPAGSRKIVSNSDAERARDGNPAAVKVSTTTPAFLRVPSISRLRPGLVPADSAGAIRSGHWPPK
jgi:hypothetical protein